jgi:hypothetical protein
MLQGLQSFMQNPGSASGNYIPRFTAPDISASQGFSLGKSMGRFGEGAGTIGMIGDMVLPMIFRSQGGSGLDWGNIVNRINLARGVADPMREVQARQYSQVMASIGAQDLGIAAASALRLDPGSTLSNMVMSGAPVIDQLTGGLLSDVARIVDPNLITRRGGAGLISAQRGLDPMHRLDTAMTGHIKSTLQGRSRMDYRGRRLGDVDGGRAEDFTLRDNTLTAGMNLDDFAEVMAMTVDLNALDFAGGLNDTELTNKAKASLLSRVGAGYSSADLANEKRGIRLAGATVQGAANMSRVVATLGSTLGEGMSVGERGNLAARLGIVPGSGKDAAEIQDTLRQIKALGEASGQTAKQMLDAGTAITRQFGGNLLINTATAAFAQTARRLGGQALNDAGVTRFQDVLDESTSAAAQDTVNAQQSSLMRMVLAGYNSPEYGPRIQRALATGNGADLWNLALEPGGRGLQRLGADLTQAQVTSGLGGLAQMFGPVATNLTMKRALLSSHTDAVRRMGTVHGVGGAIIDPMKILDAFNAADINDSEVAIALGMDPGRSTEDTARLQGLLGKMGLEGLRAYDFQTSLTKSRGAIAAGLRTQQDIKRIVEATPDIEVSAMKQKLSSLLTGTLNPSGIQKALALIRDQKTDLATTKGLMAVFEESGAVLPQDRQRVLTEMEHSTPAQLKKTADIVTDFYEAFNDASRASGSTDPERRASIQKRLIATSLRMNEIGLRTDLDIPWDKVGAAAWKAIAHPMEALGLGKYFSSSKNDGADIKEGGKAKPEEKRVTLTLTIVPPSNVDVSQSASDSDVTVHISKSSVETVRR